MDHEMADPHNSDAGTTDVKPSDSSPVRQIPAEPRWHALVALLVAGGLYATLHETLSAGPRWLLLVILICTAIPNLVAHQRGYHRVNSFLGFMTESVATAFLLWSVVMLVKSLPGREISPGALLRSAAVLWLCNIILFSLWYWRLDAGGPYARHRRGQHSAGAFLFPPMTNDGRRAAATPWAPRFIDYLFLSFNTSTALSPTDAPVLSRWAKVLVMLQALISLTCVVVLAARAVNLL